MKLRVNPVLRPKTRRIFPDEEGTESRWFLTGFAGRTSARRIFPDEEGTESSSGASWGRPSLTQNLPR